MLTELEGEQIRMDEKEREGRKQRRKGGRKEEMRVDEEERVRKERE